MPSPKTSKEITCHQITSMEESPAVFHEVLALSKQIFDPDTPESELPPYHLLCTWESHIALPNSIIIYATDPDSQPLGFFFAIPRTHPEIGHELLHIWLAGVDPQARGLGIFPLLMDKVKEHAHRSGYKEITVCTFPKRFDQMYRILGKHGWEVVAWPLKHEKVLMKLTL